jgi:uncharacterized membrane protein
MAESTNPEDEISPLALEGVADRVSANQAIDLMRDIEVDLNKKLPQKERGRVIPVVREIVEKRAAFFSGPQPPPELIAEYERVAPGWGIRILEMGEREQLHRHQCDNEILAQNNRELDQSQSWIEYLGRGQILGFVAFIVIALIGAYALRLGSVTVACICFGTFAVGVITAFVKGGPPKRVEDEASVDSEKKRSNKKK